MGARLLRARLLEPLTEPLLILARHDAVAELAETARLRDTLGEALAAVRDLERLVARCVQRSAGPRDLGAVRQACAALPAIQDILNGVRSGELAAAAARCVAPDDLAMRLREALVDDPPATARDGGCIRAGADAELDELVAAGAGARTWIAGLEEAERQRTAISSLKVGYNRVFGYYIEVPNAHRDAVPGDYVRKQTLVGAERYITAELKERETVVLGARDPPWRARRSCSRSSPPASPRMPPSCSTPRRRWRSSTCTARWRAWRSPSSGCARSWTRRE